jgi:hypothetical protein
LVIYSIINQDNVYVKQLLCTKYLNIGLSFALYAVICSCPNLTRYHALNLILLVVTNRSKRDICLESLFGLHVDTNYCVHENFHLASHIRLLSCISFVWNMMLKLLYYLNYVVVNKRIIYDHIYCSAVILYCEILVHVKHTMLICIKGRVVTHFK